MTKGVSEHSELVMICIVREVFTKEKIQGKKRYEGNEHCFHECTDQGQMEENS